MVCGPLLPSSRMNALSSPLTSMTLTLTLNPSARQRSTVPCTTACAISIESAFWVTSPCAAAGSEAAANSTEAIRKNRIQNLREECILTRSIEIGGKHMRSLLILVCSLVAAAALLAQNSTLTLDTVERKMPDYIVERLTPEDRVLFDKLMRVGLESAWSLVTAEGYPQNFINELSPLKPNTRMVGRARTMRYLPNRKDVRDKLYAAGPQLNYKSAEEAQPGDVLVFDAGGETRAGVSGGVTTVRFLVRGGAGLVIDGAMRDVPELEAMPVQTYMRRGHASSVAPLMMSVDYQVPVRIGRDRKSTRL